MSDEWRWADPQGQQRLVRTDELRAALANGIIPPNAPVWQKGWTEWRAANDVPELQSGKNGTAPAAPAPAAAAKAPDEKPGAGEQPPPPPRYVPAAGKVQPATDIPATASTSPAMVAARAARAAVSKKTVMGIAPAGPGANAPPKAGPAPVLPSLAAKPPQTSASRAPSPPSSASDALKRALPESASRAPQKAAGAATVVGVPAIPDPRDPAPAPAPSPAPAAASPAPAAASPAPGATSPSPRPGAIAEQPQKDKSGKRQTLILYGGAPQDDEAPAEPPASAAPAAPPIVVPAPGAQPGKNAVTQAPPWGEGAVGIGPEIPKSAPTPRVKQDSVEEISGSVLVESDDDGPVAVERVAPGATSASFQGGTQKPPPFRPRSVPPPVPKRLSAGGGADEASVEGGGRAAPTVPPASAVPREMREPMPSETNDRPKATDTFPWMEPVLDRFPQLRRLQEGKPKLFLPVVFGLGAFVLLLLFAKGCSALFGGGETTTTTSTHPSATPSASAAPPASATSTTPTAAASASAAPPATPGPATACTVVGEPRSVGAHALVPSGVEVLAAPNGIALGFATGPKDAVVELVDPTSLAVTSTAKLHAVDTLKRVTPLVSAKGLAVAGDLDRRSDKLAGRRTIADESPIDVGVADNGLAVATHGSDKTTQLWPLSGDGPAEALRGVAVHDAEGFAYALTFRRGGAIWLGYLASGKPPKASGDLAGVAGLGPVVGSPSIATSGDQALVVWADRATSDEPWGLRWQRGKLGAAPSPAKPFTPPAGGLGAPFMSPSVVGLGHGRFLMVWTEGEVASHQVRALTVDEQGNAVGTPLVVSTEGLNAGQGQAAVGPDGKGLIAYLAANGKGFEVMATSISCAAR